MKEITRSYDERSCYYCYYHPHSHPSFSPTTTLTTITTVVIIVVELIKRVNVRIRVKVVRGCKRKTRVVWFRLKESMYNIRDDKERYVTRESVVLVGGRRRRSTKSEKEVLNPSRWWMKAF